jgi:IS30 family transposase
MTKAFTHLDFRARDRIEALLMSGHAQREIADILGIHKSTVCREIQHRRKEDGIYSATAAEQKAGIKRSNSKHQGMKIEKNQDLRTYIISALKQCQSPECIAGKMKIEKWAVRVSSDAIYRWLRSPFGQKYCIHLCTKRYRKKSQLHTPQRHTIPHMESIHNMPCDFPGIVTEGDTFLSPKKVSKTSAVVVAWRSTKLIKGDLIKSLSPIHTTKVMQKIHLTHISDAMILDQGIENIQHKQFGMSTYFCDPASPRQKPLIENSIGQLRRWFWPKGTNLSKISKKEFQEKIEIMNNKYKKSLQYRSANEVSKEYGIFKSN